MRCSKRLESVLFFLAAFFLVVSAQAADILAQHAELAPADDGYSLSADFSIDLGPRLESVVNKGVALYFTADFELTRSRWYWFDEKVVQRSKTFQLSYHALTRQYRLSSGALHQSFGSLEEALHVLSRLRHWQVIEKGEVASGILYLAGVRLRLDPSLMPKTFQVSALSNREWNLSSEWLHWNFSVTETGEAPEAGNVDNGAAR